MLCCINKVSIVNCVINNYWVHFQRFPRFISSSRQANDTAWIQSYCRIFIWHNQHAQSRLRTSIACSCFCGHKEYRANQSIMSAREMSCITSFSDLRIRREENQPSSHSKEQISCKQFARYLFFTMRTDAYSVQPCSKFVYPDMIDEEV